MAIAAFFASLMHKIASSIPVTLFHPNPLIEKLLTFLIPYDPESIGIFGSFARGEHTPASDIDVLIRFKERISLLKIVSIEQDISDKLGIQVELVTENSLKNTKLKKYIENDLIPIYG